MTCRGRPSATATAGAVALLLSVSPSFGQQPAATEPAHYSLALMFAGIGVSAASLAAVSGGVYLFTVPTCDSIRVTDGPQVAKPTCRDEDALAPALIALGVVAGAVGIGMIVMGSSRPRSTGSATSAVPSVYVSARSVGLRGTF